MVMEKGLWEKTYGYRMDTIIKTIKEAMFKNDYRDLNLNEIIVMIQSCINEISRLNVEMQLKDEQIQGLQNTINEIFNGDPNKPIE